jgi:serine/threonine-protein kinase
MKHLSEIPEPPSELRPEIETDLDLIVLRALAKEPADRYQSAVAMDADLETVARGGHVPAETAEAATVVLSSSRADGSTAVTRVTRRPRPGGTAYPPEFDPRPRRRSAWPWLLGLGALLALLVGGFLAWPTIQDQLEGSDQVAVPYVVGLGQAQAVDQITQRDLVPRVRRVANSDVEEGLVFAQEPTEGTRVDKETVIFIDVSSGKPKVTIPSVVGQTVEDAVAELTRAGLDAQVVEVNSEREEGTVTAQKPGAGTVVVEGTQVRINVSKGPRPVTVPNVVGLPYDQAASELQRAGFGVARVDVASDQTKDTVVDQEPNGGSESSRGATVTLSVSRGPVTSAVPDVTTQDVTVAETTLTAAGFRTSVILEDTDDPTLDGIVLSQDPAGGSQAKPNTVVTLFVGRYTGDDTTPIP